jgi:hypothetical protein
VKTSLSLGRFGLLRDRRSLLLLAGFRLWRRRWLTWCDPLQHTVKCLTRFIGAQFQRRFLELGGLLRSGHLAFHQTESKLALPIRHALAHLPCGGTLAFTSGASNEQDVNLLRCAFGNGCCLRKRHAHRGELQRRRQWQYRLQQCAIRVLKGTRRSTNKEHARQKESCVLEYSRRRKRSASRRSNPSIFGRPWILSRKIKNWYGSSAPRSIHNSANRWRSLQFICCAIGALKRYGLIPTVTLICAIGESSWCVLSAVIIFLSFSTSASARAASFVDSGASSWTYKITPATTLIIQIGFGGTTLDQLASTKTNASSSAKSSDSRSSVYGSTSKDWPTNRPTLLEISFLSDFVSDRAAKRFSSEIISSRWLRLIASSNANNPMLQSNSIVIPNITNRVDNRLFRLPSVACSQMIPKPTAIVPSTSPMISTHWIVDTSQSGNDATKEAISDQITDVLWMLAILGALFAFLCAMWALIKAILAERHKR